MRYLFLLFLLTGPVSLLRASESPLWDILSPAHRAQLNAGNHVMFEEEIPGNPWPRFTVYRLLNKATPEQVAAVFWDCKIDPEYVPNCRKVSVLSRPSANVVEAEYTLKMPFLLPDEIYVSRNELVRSEPGVFEISWKVLRSRYTKSCSGRLVLEQHGGDTLLCYSNLVEPGSRIAGIMRGHAAREVEESVRELARQVAREISSGSALMEQQIGVLGRASGKGEKDGAAPK